MGIGRRPERRGFRSFGVSVFGGPAHLLSADDFFDGAVGLVIGFFRFILIIGRHAGDRMKEPNVFLIAVLNCFWPDGTMNPSRTRREVRYLGRFLSSVLVILVLFIGLTAGPIVWVHSYIVPLPILFKVFSAFHVDEEAWEENIFEGEAGAVREEYEDWRKEEGTSRETSLTLQKFLWHSWYILAAYGLFLMLSFYLLLIRIFRALFSNYKKQVFHRERSYFSRTQKYDADGDPRPEPAMGCDGFEVREARADREKGP